MKHSVAKVIGAWRRLNTPILTAMMLLVLLVCAACSHNNDRNPKAASNQGSLPYTNSNLIFQE